jgi:hypothetical protein
MSAPEILDPADIKPGQQAPVPTSKDALVIEALRFANRVSLLLGDLDRAILGRITDDDDTRFDDLHDLIIRRFSDCSGLHLFIAANNLRLELPPDLQDEPETECDDD